MSAYDYTAGFGFELINYQTAGWHTSEYRNWRNLDGILASVLEDGIPFDQAAGATNAYTVTYSPVPVAYTEGMQISFATNAANTGAATINVNGLGAKNLFRDGAALESGDLVANQYVRAVYDGTQFLVIEPKNTEFTIDDGSITPAKLSTGGPTWDGSGNTSVTGTFKSDGLLRYGASTGGLVAKHNDTALGSHNVYFSTLDPSGGANGDIWYKYTA